MKTFKSLSTSILAAAATLATVVLTAPAQAGWGHGASGPVLNGPVLQGPVLQGPTLNGPTLNGISLNGVAISSAAQPGRFVAVTLPSGETISLR